MWLRNAADGELAAWNHPATLFTQAATPRVPSCNPMRLRLQPYASQAATLCISGELDDSRLVDAAAGERFVFKRRGTETEAPRGDQESYLVITPRRRHGGEQEGQ